MKQLIGYLLLFTSFALHAQQDFTQYVNPFIGTGGHGHTFPGATTPFGMVQLSPDTRIDGSWDGCSGYHYSDSIIYGFSHTHLSGTGCSDYGDVMLMPMQQQQGWIPAEYSSAFSHTSEKAEPGYYRVTLKKENILTELSATTRTGIHRYTFNKSGKGYLLIDLNHRDELTEFHFTKQSDQYYAGMRRSKAWAKDQQVFYALNFSEPVKKITYNIDGKTYENSSSFPSKYSSVKILFEFDLPPSGILEARVALSPVDETGALNNLKKESDAKSFETIRNEAKKLWNEELGKIQVKGDNNDELVIFYTALYHCMIAPNIAMDADRRYRGRDNQIHTADNFDYYSVFSLWDTFRALHPLLSIIDEKRTRDFAKTFLVQYQQAGRLPVWELWCNETDCMIGYHSVSVLADAAVKGMISKEETALALDAAITSATWNHLGLPAMMEKQHITIDDESESVSKTLEYAYDDWCIIQLAEMAGKLDKAKPYRNHAMGYIHLFDPETRFFRPRKNGGWLQPFDPYEVNNHYTEANAWHYAYFVPHDIQGLINLHGSTKLLEDHLDSLFNTRSKTSGRTQADITGMIGQYAHGNEPSHHVAFLYNYLNKPQKTAYYVNRIRKELYQNTPDGLPGNEDCGQMSAWYVMVALGIYQMAPGNPEYTLTTPLFADARIKTATGNYWAIKSNQTSANQFIQQANWNGSKLTSLNISHAEIRKGGTLEYAVTSDNDIALPSAAIPSQPFTQRRVLAAPVIKANGNAFQDSLLITFQSLNKSENQLWYTMNGKDPDVNSTAYQKPFWIHKSCTLKVIEWGNNNVQSPMSKGIFYKKPHHWKISIRSTYNPQYDADGPEGIIDGIRGNKDWRKGGWQGYQAQDFEAIIELDGNEKINELYAGFLQDTRSWILLPSWVEFWGSEDGNNFTLLGKATHNFTDRTDDVLIHDMKVVSPKKETSKKLRFIKVKAGNYGKLPAWHPGSGGDAFIFIDEIYIR